MVSATLCSVRAQPSAEIRTIGMKLNKKMSCFCFVIPETLEVSKSLPRHGRSPS